MKIETHATSTTPAHETQQRAAAALDVTTDGLMKRLAELDKAHKAQSQLTWLYYQRALAAEKRAEALHRVAEAAYQNLTYTWEADLMGPAAPFNLTGLDPEVMNSVDREVYWALKALGEKE
jgi:hypothetical protein